MFQGLYHADSVEIKWHNAEISA